MAPKPAVPASLGCGMLFALPVIGLARPGLIFACMVSLLAAARPDDVEAFAQRIEVFRGGDGRAQWARPMARSVHDRYGVSPQGVLLFIVLLCGAGVIAGLTAGLFGVGGGFVVVPVLLAVFPFLTDQTDNLMMVAVGTSLATIVISSARSVHAHSKRGAVDFDVLRDWAMWVVVGVCGGLALASVADGERLIMVFAVGVLIYSIYFLFPGMFDRFHGRWSMPTGPGRALLASGLGGFSALLGVGGGTIMVLTMVLCNRPIHQAVATASGIGFLIGVPGMLGFLILGLGKPDLPFGSLGYVNLPALLAISLFSLFTAPIGARWAHSLDAAQLKRVFGVYLVVVSVSMYCKA